MGAYPLTVALWSHVSGAPGAPDHLNSYIPEPSSLAVEGEKIGIEIILVPKEAEFFAEQHIQSPPKTASGKSC